MEKRGLKPETVPLPHDTEGYWLGNKDAKNVLVFFHGVYNSISSTNHRYLGRVTKPTQIPRTTRKLI